MKVCPKCNREYQDFEHVCAICGSPLIAKGEVAGGTSFDMGRANAISGGVHVDSHNVTNTTNIVEAQKSELQLIQENENNFMQAVQQRCANGMITQQALAELNMLAQQFRIGPQRANEIIELVRKNSALASGGQGNEFLVGQMLQEVYDALCSNNVDILKHKFKNLESIAQTSADFNIQNYYHLLLASFSPETSTVSLMGARTDNYWQFFWGHVAYVKLGQMDKAGELLSKLGGFGQPQGDIALLMSLDNLAEFRKNPMQPYYLNQMQQYLQQAMEVGISDQLAPLWNALSQIWLDEPNPEVWYQFYCDYTLKELCPVKLPPVPNMPAPPPMPTQEKQAADMKKMAMPPAPDMSAQTVNLAQMQGFNPLQAAKQMGLGQMPPMGSTNFGGLPTMPGMGMPGFGNVPPMPGTPTPPIPGGNVPPLPPAPNSNEDLTNN